MIGLLPSGTAASGRGRGVALGQEGEGAEFVVVGGKAPFAMPHTPFPLGDGVHASPFWVWDIFASFFAQQMQQRW